MSGFSRPLQLGTFVFQRLETNGNFPIQGVHSGLYYDPARSVEGINLIIAEQDQRRVLVINWYTYHNNQQFWLTGNTNFEAGIERLTIDIFSTQGSGFGPEFNPDNFAQVRSA